MVQLVATSNSHATANYYTIVTSLRYYACILGIIPLVTGLAHPRIDAHPYPVQHWTIPLDKQYVPVKRKGRTTMHKTAYFGQVFIGLPKPQKFTVVFDTGSGHFFVPATDCDSTSCQSHQRYSRSASMTVTNVTDDGSMLPSGVNNRDQIEIAFGTGQVFGDFSQELVCLMDPHGKTIAAALNSTDCARLNVVFATKMSDQPFSAFKFDGVLGLGLPGLALNPEFSFFGQITKLNPMLPPQFGMFVSPDDRIPSQITFGGYDLARMAGEPQWTPVVDPLRGHWQVGLKAVKVGGVPVQLCEQGECVAVVDTGTSVLGAPKQILQHLHRLLARKAVNISETGTDCRTQSGPNIVFEFGDFEITLAPEDYTRPSGTLLVNNASNQSQFICRASMIPVDSKEALGDKAWILGEPILRRYYTTYDWGKQRVGFAPSVSPPTPAAGAQGIHLVHDIPPTEPPTPTIVYI